MFKVKFLVRVLIVQHFVDLVTGDHMALVRCTQAPDCLESLDAAIVSSIRENMLNEAEPCGRFWDYACGNWTAAPYYDHVDNFGAINNYYVEQVQRVLEDNSQHGVKNLLSKMRSVYEACKNTKTYYLEMWRYFREAPIEWPDFGQLVQRDSWNHTNFNWLHAIASWRRFGLNGVFLDESVGWASNDSTKFIIELKIPGEAVHFRDKYDVLHYLTEFEWVQPEQVTAQQLNLAAEVNAFEFKLRAIRAAQRDISETQLSLSELQQKVPNIDWQAYFSILLRAPVDARRLVLEVAGLDYMQQIAELLDQTHPKIAFAYITLRLCKFLMEIRPLITAKNCVNHLGVAMPLGMNFIYESLIYKTRTQDEVALQRLFVALKGRFSRYLQANKLKLTAPEVSYLLQKLLKMRLQLGNLPQIRHAAYYDEYYRHFNASATNFFHNHWELLRFRTQEQHAPLLVGGSHRVSLETFYVNDDISQPRSAPYFVHQRNLLVVPFVFPLLPFFHHQLDPLLQYSLVGWILAHEINHGFESEGVVLDADGNESPIGRAIKHSPAFMSAIKCVLRRPTAAVLERIADVNGMQLAYDAYFDLTGKSSAPNPGTPTFAGEFSKQQLFFLNFAQFFCGGLPTAIDHDRDDVRVEETLANLPEFAAAFQCNDARSSNPEQQCQMWRA